MPLLLLLFFFFLLPLLQCSGPKKRKSSTTNTLRNSIKRSSCYRGRLCVRELWFSSSEYVSNWRKLLKISRLSWTIIMMRCVVAAHSWQFVIMFLLLHSTDSTNILPHLLLHLLPLLCLFIVAFGLSIKLP